MGLPHGNWAGSYSPVCDAAWGPSLPWALTEWQAHKGEGGGSTGWVITEELSSDSLILSQQPEQTSVAATLHPILTGCWWEKSKCEVNQQLSGSDSKSAISGLSQGDIRQLQANLLDHNTVQWGLMPRRVDWREVKLGGMCFQISRD